jgi:hypothetical protein
MTSTAKISVLAALNVVVLAVALLAGATVTSGDPEPTPASLVLNGTAEVDAGSGIRRLEAGEHDLATGDRVRIVTGDAILALGGAGSLELRAASITASGSRVEIGAVPVLLDGEALIVAGAQEQAVEAGGGRLALADGAARVSRSTSALFAVYEGQGELSTAGRTLDGGLPALRQVVLTDAGMLPLAPSPLRVSDPPGPWDRRFLGDAIDLTSVLDQRSIGFTTLLQDDFVPDVFFYHAVLEGLLHEPGFDQSLLGQQARPVGETLVGAAIALVGEGGDFATRWRETFELREQGASWGIIALDQDADRASLLAVLDDAVTRSPLLFAPPSSGPVFQPVRPPVRTPRPPLPPLAPLPDVPSRTPIPQPPRVAPPEPSPNPPAPAPSQPDDDGVLDPVVDPLADLLEGVLDGLGGVTDGLL